MHTQSRSFCNEGACSPGGDNATFEAGTGFRQVSYEFDGTRPVLGNMVGTQPEGPLGKLTDVQVKFSICHFAFGKFVLLKSAMLHANVTTGVQPRWVFDSRCIP